MLSCVQPFATPQTVAHRIFCPWDSPGKNTGAGCHFTLQGTVMTHGLPCPRPEDCSDPQAAVPSSRGPSCPEVVPSSRGPSCPGVEPSSRGPSCPGVEPSSRGPSCPGAELSLLCLLHSRWILHCSAVREAVG